MYTMLFYVCTVTAPSVYFMHNIPEIRAYVDVAKVYSLLAKSCEIESLIIESCRILCMDCISNGERNTFTQTRLNDGSGAPIDHTFAAALVRPHCRRGRRERAR